MMVMMVMVMMMMMMMDVWIGVSRETYVMSSF